MEKTWFVMCPNWEDPKHINKMQGWSLFKEALDNIGTDYFIANIECSVCGKKFSLQKGVSEAFSSDILINDFCHNSSERGKTKITVGDLKTIKFKEPFLDAPEVAITPLFKPVNAVTGYVTPKRFVILSCANGCSMGEEVEMNWSAWGNRDQREIPVWRQLVSSSKEQQRSRNYRLEIVELESAFEVFFSEYLAKNLSGRLNLGTIKWLLKLNIDTQLSVGYRELTGKKISGEFPIEHQNWSNCVKKVRDSIVHQGAIITPEQALYARKAFFNLLTKIDSSTMKYFETQMENVGTNKPYCSFGKATVKLGK